MIRRSQKWDLKQIYRYVFCRLISVLKFASHGLRPPEEVCGGETRFLRGRWRLRVICFLCIKLVGTSFHTGKPRLRRFCWRRRRRFLLCLLLELVHLAMRRTGGLIRGGVRQRVSFLGQLIRLWWGVVGCVQVSVDQ